MRQKLSIFVYTLCCNIPVCFCLCLASSISGVSSWTDGVLTIDFPSINWLFLLYNFLVGITIAELVGNFIPLSRIAAWFAAKHHVRNDTYAGNMPFRLLSCLIITLIYFVFISPSLTLFSHVVLHVFNSFNEAFLSFLKNAPLILTVGFVTSLLFDIPSYQVARLIYPEF